MDYIYYKNLAIAFEKCYNYPGVNLSKAVAKGRQLASKGEFNDKLAGVIPFEDVSFAFAYIFWMEDQIDSSYLIDGIPLNINPDTKNVEEEFAVYLSYPREFKKQNSDVPVAQYFKQFVFVKKEHINKLEHVFISNTEYFITQSHKFRITFIPVGTYFAFNNIHKDKSKFIQGKNTAHNIFKNSLKKAYTENSAIIFSCEMTGCEEIDDFVEESFELDSSLCVACPSYHRIEDGKNYNKSKIFYYASDGMLNDLIVEKGEKFIEQDKGNIILTEAIDSTDAKFVVFHLKHIGVVLFVICKDALTNSFEKLIEVVNPNITIVIAYTKTHLDFSARMAKYTATGNLCIIGNACSALLDKDDMNQEGIKLEPIVVYQNDKLGIAKTGVKGDICDKHCKDYCDSDGYCYFNIDIDVENMKGYKALVKRVTNMKEE